MALMFFVGLLIGTYAGCAITYAWLTRDDTDDDDGGSWVPDHVPDDLVGHR